MSVVFPVSIESVEFYMRNVRVRIPFRYGNACLLGSPLLHVRLRARDAKGNVAEGVSADALPPKWFDKAPEKDYRQNIADLLVAVRHATEMYRCAASSPRSVFEIWQDAYRNTVKLTNASGLNNLVGSFGSSLMERALFDAAGKLAGKSFHAMLRDGSLGIVPEAVHPELAGRRVVDSVAATPGKTLFVRHTVGLSDPIEDGDITPEDRVTDGLPQSLDAILMAYELHYFKLKIFGKLELDVPRLTQIANLLEAHAPRDYKATLDGNEQFKSPADLKNWLDAVSAEPVLQKLLKRIVFIEQPMDRAIALTEAGAKGFSGFKDLPPVIIDESDDGLNVFKQAVSLGYRGVSTKNCKGVFKGLFNRMLVDYFNQRDGGGYQLSGEDLTNVPIVPLQQDSCTLSCLGVAHAERNGHHYYRGLDHLSRTEREACIRTHSPLYERWDRSGRLRMIGGQLDLSSLHVPGFGVGVDIDWPNMTPLADWSFESMGF
jgi:hypothetical protein